MTQYFFCTYLASEVELTDEREQHILQRHPDLPSSYLDLISDALASPDEVRCDVRYEDTLLFSRWCPTLRKGRHIVVVVVQDSQNIDRYFIVTAYLSRTVTQGEVVWMQN